MSLSTKHQIRNTACAQIHVRCQPVGELKRFRILTTAIICVAGSGCAIHWYDQKNGTEHIWGFGHLAVKVSECDKDGVRAVVRESSLVGVGMGVHESGGYAAIGYHADRRMHIQNDTNFWIGWMGHSLFRTRVGAVPPWWDSVPDVGANPKSWEHDAEGLR